MIARVLALIAAALLLVPAARAAPDPRAARTDALLATMVEADEPGMAIGVWSRGSVVYRSARGMADVEQRTPLSPASVFHLASLSKQLTGLAVLKLAAAGKVDIDADVHRYLPELPDYGATIRVRHLLTMSSGLKDQWALVRLSGRDWQDTMTREMLFEVITRVTALDFAPGAEYAYSNSNYSLLAEIVARVTGKPFAAAMQDLVLRPAGLASTFVYDDVHRTIPGRANSYWRLSTGAPWNRQLLLYQAWGATSVQSTLDDVLRWGVTLSRERMKGQLLYEALAQPSLLTDGRANTYGAGLYRGMSLGHTTYEHGGADASFRHMLRYYPDEDLGIVVLMNRQEDAAAVAERVARLWLSDAPPEVRRSPAGQVPAGAAGVYAGGRTDAALRIAARPSGLVAEFADAAEVPLVAIGRDTLASGDGAVTLTVRRDRRGAVIGLDAEENRDHARLTRRRLRRLAPPRSIRTAEYLGEYRNPALGTTYLVRAKGQALELSPLLSPLSFALEPTDPDRFEAWDYAFRTVKFVRTGGRVAALVVSGDRATDMRFDRLPAVTATSAPHR